MIRIKDRIPDSQYILSYHPIPIDTRHQKHVIRRTNLSIILEFSDFGTAYDDGWVSERRGDLTMLLFSIRNLRSNFREFLEKLISGNIRSTDSF